MPFKVKPIFISNGPGRLRPPHDPGYAVTSLRMNTIIDAAIAAAT